MKFLIIFCLPVVFGAAVPQKRVLFDTFLNGAEAQNVINQLVTFLSTEDNEAKCEQECHTLIANQQSLVQHLCPFMCRAAQQALSGIHAGKRLVFDTFLNGEEAKHLVDQLVELLATDDNEVKCESHCHTLIRNQQSVLQHLCPFLCHSAQTALAHLHSPNTDPTVTGKRLVLDNFLNTQETAHLVDQLVATLGSDESEAQCEKECHVLIRDSTSVFQHMCPFLCHSAQAIVNMGHHNTPPPAKRLVLDTFLNTQETAHIVDQLVATLSSDETEVACEKECHVLIRDSTSVFQHMCPFLCHSAQAIFNRGHTTAATAVKRSNP
ncbi:uncharacterized protein LOC133188551 [Saccostrea echinata]|uniref:uncharacterized protein LOC133188551 n=1 Tax=Saccostrea echinata TaxID=191078 RepID=UPI002A802F32|nr:uncharacterized protein LOC133188551 [Saccostrea echinata]